MLQIKILPDATTERLETTTPQLDLGSRAGRRWSLTADGRWAMDGHYVDASHSIAPWLALAACGRLHQIPNELLHALLDPWPCPLAASSPTHRVIAQLVDATRAQMGVAVRGRTPLSEGLRSPHASALRDMMDWLLGAEPRWVCEEQVYTLDPPLVAELLYALLIVADHEAFVLVRSGIVMLHVRDPQGTTIGAEARRVFSTLIATLEPGDLARDWQDRILEHLDEVSRRRHDVATPALTERPVPTTVLTLSTAQQRMLAPWTADLPPDAQRRFNAALAHFAAADERAYAAGSIIPSGVCMVQQALRGCRQTGDGRLTTLMDRLSAQRPLLSRCASVLEQLERCQFGAEILPHHLARVVACAVRDRVAHTDDLTDLFEAVSSETCPTTLTTLLLEHDPWHLSRALAGARWSVDGTVMSAQHASTLVTACHHGEVSGAKAIVWAEILCNRAAQGHGPLARLHDSETVLAFSPDRPPTLRNRKGTYALDDDGFATETAPRTPHLTARVDAALGLHWCTATPVTKRPHPADITPPLHDLDRAATLRRRWSGRRH